MCDDVTICEHVDLFPLIIILGSHEVAIDKDVLDTIFGSVDNMANIDKTIFGLNIVEIIDAYFDLLSDIRELDREVFIYDVEKATLC